MFEKFRILHNLLSFFLLHRILQYRNTKLQYYKVSSLDRPCEPCLAEVSR